MDVQDKKASEVFSILLLGVYDLENFILAQKFALDKNTKPAFFKC